MSAHVDVPTTPEPDPFDYRTQSAPVVIQTVSGEWYTARWVVYVDQDEDGIPPCWELIGRDGLQLERAEVVAWFYPSAVAELIEAGVELQAAMDENETAASKFDKSSADRFHKADVRHRAALARVTGGAS